MPRLIIVRHGETDWNSQQIFRGRVDVPLNEVGRQQAAATAELLKTVPVTAVISSPLARAMETAAAIAVHHRLDVEIDQGINDFNYGAWEGLSDDKVGELYPEKYQKWHSAPHKVVIPGGESLEDLRCRARLAVNRQMERFPKGNIVLVAHRVVNKILVLSLLGLDSSMFWNIRQDTCAINVFDHDPGHGFVCVRVNDTCHLRNCPMGNPTDF